MYINDSVGMILIVLHYVNKGFFSDFDFFLLIM